MFAPLITATTSAVSEPGNRSAGFFLFIIFPINDLFDTETSTGWFCLIDFRLTNNERSLSNHSELIFVKNGPFPDFLKKPIAGSSTIFFIETPANFASFRLSFRSSFVFKI